MMKPITIHSGIAAPLLFANINTDTIIPSREMKRVSKTGFADGLFANMRYLNMERKADPAFILNQPAYRGASVLLTGDNFGCGSSREHAVWALYGFGFKVIVAESFGSIFFDNCITNGVLPVRLSHDTINQFARYVSADPQNRPLAIDLEARTVVAGALTCEFEIPDTARDLLMKGHAPIDVTLERIDAINHHMGEDKKRRPWLYAMADGG